ELNINSHLTSISPVQLTKNGKGRVTLDNDNSGFTGVITVQDGILRARDSRSLGTTASGTIVLSSFLERGQLQLEPHTGERLIIAEPLRLNGPGPVNDGALLNVSGDNIITGSIILDSDVTIGANKPLPNAAANLDR